jgi:hypothetical protein
MVGDAILLPCGSEAGGGELVWRRDAHPSAPRVGACDTPGVLGFFTGFAGRRRGLPPGVRFRTPPDFRSGLG